MNHSLNKKMPILFIGHGSPMNAIDENNYTKMLNRLGASLPQPRAILVISAHWVTNGSWVTAMAKPKTIHDFGGFPQQLFDVQYPAPGSPDIARLVQNTVLDFKIYGDENQWGLDHGTWSVLKHMYPKAEIPVLQLSLDVNKPLDYHWQIGQQLSKLRYDGILVLGSGNLIHNLQHLNWDQKAKPYEWALEFDKWLKEKIEQRDFDSVLKDFHSTHAGRLSVPTLEHYLPLHYILGASEKSDQLVFEYEEIQNASISMRSFRLC